MKIKDLSICAELSRVDVVRVRGGLNAAVVGGQVAGQSVAGGGIFSPTTAVNAAVNAPSVAQFDNDAFTFVSVDTTNVVGSMDTLVGVPYRTLI